MSTGRKAAMQRERMKDMLYDTLMRKAIEATIVNEDGNIYLVPEYRKVLRDEKLTADKVTDTKVTDEEIWDYLKLEVERLREVGTKREYFYEWMYDIITGTIDPAMTDQENELFKNMMDYMKLNSEVKEKDIELKEREEKLKDKEEFVDKKADVGIAGFNFAKKNKM